MEFRVIRSSQFPDEKPRNVKNIYEKGDGYIDYIEKIGDCTYEI